MSGFNSLLSESPLPLQCFYNFFYLLIFHSICRAMKGRKNFIFHSSFFRCFLFGVYLLQVRLFPELQLKMNSALVHEHVCICQELSELHFDYQWKNVLCDDGSLCKDTDEWRTILTHNWITKKTRCGSINHPAVVGWQLFMTTVLQNLNSTE